MLLIDETLIRKRHRYVTVVLDGDTGELLAMIEGRSKAVLSRFFIAQGPRWGQNVKTVITEGSRSYRAAVQRYLPGVCHVLDLNWSDEILNSHHHRCSNGPLEGTNNLIQTLRRTAHGFTNPHNYAARGLLLT